MEYPFKFSELLLTNTLLKTLGFNEWFDDCGGKAANGL